MPIGFIICGGFIIYLLLISSDNIYVNSNRKYSNTRYKESKIFRYIIILNLIVYMTSYVVNHSMLIFFANLLNIVIMVNIVDITLRELIYSYLIIGIYWLWLFYINIVAFEYNYILMYMICIVFFNKNGLLLYENLISINIFTLVSQSLNYYMYIGEFKSEMLEIIDIYFIIVLILGMTNVLNQRINSGYEKDYKYNNSNVMCKYITI